MISGAAAESASSRLDPYIQVLFSTPQGQPTITTRIATLLAVLPHQRQVQAIDTIQRRKLNHFAALSYVRGLAGKDGRAVNGRKVVNHNERVLLTAMGNLLDQFNHHDPALESRSLAEWQLAVSQVDLLIAALMKFKGQLGMPGEIASSAQMKVG
jgi:hypothetical protein